LFGNVNERFGTPHWGLTASYLICVTALAGIPSLVVSISSLMFFGAMLNLGLILSITIVTLAGFVFPKRFPELYGRSVLRISPALLRTVCIVIVILNTLIFSFFAFAIGKFTLVFLGIVLTSCLYAFSRKRRLAEIKETLYPPGERQTPKPFWMEQSKDHEG
jgi:amino acid transporter